jgi:carboxymethylenebutenolidase
MKFSSQTITLKSFDDSDMIAYIAAPETGGRQPAIIIVHEAWGLNEQIKGVANRYAEQGFAAIAPHLFSRQKDLTEQAIEKAMKEIWQIPPEKRGDPNAIQSLMKTLPENDQKIINFFFTGRENAEKTMAEDLLFLVNYIKTVETIESESLGITGFCLGGGLSYRLATMYPFKARFLFTVQTRNHLKKSTE